MVKLIRVDVVVVIVVVLCCVVVVMCGGFCAGRQGLFVFLTCDSCQLEFYVTVEWYNIRE
jgi:hypothetical protein